jgi:hypothetical protein
MLYDEIEKILFKKKPKKDLIQPMLTCQTNDLGHMTRITP